MAEKAIRPPALVALSAACIAIGMAAGWFLRAPASTPPPADAAMAGTTTRLGGYRYVRPLLECDVSASPPRLHFERLRGELSGVVARATSLGHLTHASIYLRDLNSTATLGINETEAFSPASLLKVPVMFMVFKASEQDPGLLDRPVEYSVRAENTLVQNIPPTTSLTLGQRYPMRQLVEQMIVESDNRAMEALGAHFSPGQYVKTYEELGLPSPTPSQGDLPMTVEQYASFFRVLYNASYLGAESSERALALLARVRFVQGIVAGVPAQVTVAHKFGERRHETPEGRSVTQLHDCGVVYFPGQPYLLCVMTRGNEWPPLQAALGEISRVTWRHYEGVAAGDQGVAASGAP
jgi:beta-lactamase class A